MRCNKTLLITYYYIYLFLKQCVRRRFVTLESAQPSGSRTFLIDLLLVPQLHPRLHLSVYIIASHANRAALRG
jgi:hypothetical protein